MDSVPLADQRALWAEEVIGVNDVSVASAGDVHLVIPPHSEHLRAVRLMAADTASRAGLDYDGVEDFRLAVDELCHNAMTATDHVVFLSFAFAHDAVVAFGSTQARAGRIPELPELSEMIVRSLSDSYQFSVLNGELHFRVAINRPTLVP